MKVYMDKLKKNKDCDDEYPVEYDDLVFKLIDMFGENPKGSYGKIVKVGEMIAESDVVDDKVFELFEEVCCEWGIE